MNLQSVERKPGVISSASAAGDPYEFDLERYRARISRYLNQEDEDNPVFFEALDFAYQLHAGQRRKSGAAYISHPCAVAEILARELNFKDPLLLAGAVLHDVVEDVPFINLLELEQRFGDTIAELVDGCTKLTRHQLDRATLKDLTHSKIFLSASRRLGVLIIKLADRLHNLRTLHYLTQAKRQRIAQETVEVYAPIAARLNLFPLKREMYHLALTYLYPRKCKKILQFIREIKVSPEVTQIEEALQKALEEANLKATLRTRTKGLGTYYNSVKRTLETSNAENYIDFVVVLDSADTLDCYKALGAVNRTFPPIPRSLRDFIATPKNNGYRSLHSRIHVGGQNFLVKIRTPDMDHWSAYTVRGEWDTQDPLSDEHWHEISELLRTIGEYSGAGPQRKALIRLSESEEIFVYSPDGDIYYLPKGSIVLDFAYRIHSELGVYCEGASVNGDWSPPTRLLKDGDTVEILTSSERLDADSEIEELCKTPKARTAINRQLQQKRMQHAEDIGRQILAQEVLRHGLSTEVLEGETIRLLLDILNIKDIPELYVRLGQDQLSPHLVLYYLETPPQERERPQHSSTGAVPSERNVIVIKQLEKAAHRFARCCNPYPGQQHVVATLSERGTTFHHRDCGDLKERHGLQPQHLVEVFWNETSVWPRPLVFHLHILHKSLDAILFELSQLPSTVRILRIESTRNKHDQPMVRLTVRLKDFGESKALFERLPSEGTMIDDYRQEGEARVLSTETRDRPC
ncbi:MAG: HD domain-containing protein [Syntrophobacteraceae bacterium]|nr:HD domain-containing protein [Desulfobacteraceae bacterium]